MFSKKQLILIAVLAVLVTASLVLAVTVSVKSKTSDSESIVTDEAVSTSFAVTNYDNNNIETDQSRITFCGTSDATFPLSCNGTEISRSSSGAFAEEFSLNEGKNTFSFLHKGKTYTYTVTYNYVLISEVLPNDEIKIPSGTVIDVTVNARKKCLIYASFDGEEVKMLEGESIFSDDDTENDSDFVSYSAEFSVKDNLPDGKRLGNIEIKAFDGNHSQNESGAEVIISEYSDNGSIPSASSVTVKAPKNSKLFKSLINNIPLDDNGVEKFTLDKDYGLGNATAAIVKTDYAETFPGDSTSTLSVPLCSPLPSGTCDFITGEMDCVNEDTKKLEHYYVLKSGIKIEDKDVMLVNGYILPSNNISVIGCGHTSKGLAIVFDTSYKTPYSAKLNNQSYTDVSLKGATRPYGVSKPDGTTFEITFYNTASISGNIDISGNIVSSAKTSVNKQSSRATVSFTLKKAGAFYGYHVEYDEDGHFVLIIKGKPQRLSGYTIMLDPGHGGIDSGAVCSVTSDKNLRYECNLDFLLALRLKESLEAKGARVLLTRSDNSGLSKEERRELTRKNLPDLYVSVHCDSSSSPSATGTSSYYYSAWSQPLASEVNRSIEKTYKSSIYTDKNRRCSKGCNFYPFGVIRTDECPAMLVEFGFVSNITECEVLQNTYQRNMLADAAADGIENYCFNH